MTDTAQTHRAFLAQNTVNLARMNQIMAPLLAGAYISLYPVDFFLPHLIVPLRTLLIVRTCIVVFHFALGATAFIPAVKRIPDVLSVACFLSFSVNILILTVLTGGTSSPYDEALLATLFIMPIILPWRTAYFAPTAVVCLVLYPLALLVSGTLSDVSVAVSHAAVLFVATGFSITTCYFLEQLRHIDFVKSQDLKSALATIQEQQRNVNSDLDQARNFQHKLLRPLPTDENIEFAAMYKPADFLGGDYYDVSRMGPDWYRLFIVDVTGHGTQAAMRTMILQQQLERANRSCDTPWLLLSTMNDAVVEAFGSMVVNYCALCIDLKKHGAGWHMTGANAGLPEPTLFQRSQPILLRENGTYQGIVADLEYPRFERQLTPGDAVVLATDGVVDRLETQNAPTWIPDQAHFTAALERSALQALDSIQTRIPQSDPTDSRSDDLTMLVVRIPRPAS